MSYIANTQRTSEKAAANGYAGLDANALITAAQLGTGTDVTTKFLRGDQTYQTIATTPADTVSTQAFGDSAVGGSASTYSRGDHKHQMMADPVPTHDGLTTVHASATTIGGKTLPSGTIVGTSDSQTLSGKTLTTPTVNGAKVAIVTKVSTDSPYSAAATDYVILGNCTSGAIIINLPAAATSTGQQYKIKKIDDQSGNSLTIDGNGSETIDGDTTKVLTVRYDAVTIVCDGANWHIV